MLSKTKLSNGLTVLTAPLHETKAVTVLILVPVGSRHETKDINGGSHFVEHLLFKGTKKRPTYLDISKELDSIGAEYNAFTSKDHTGYYIKLPADKVELAFDMLSDMIFNSTFNAAEIDKERGVILEEINMYEDNPLMFVEDIFEEAMYGDQPLGWKIIGPRSVIKSVSRQKLFNYKKKHYHPNNLVLSVAGACTKQKAERLAKKYFGIKDKKKKKTSTSAVALTQKSPRVKLLYRKTEQVQMCLGFPGYGLKEKELLSSYILAAILGGNMSSRLFVTVREQHGLAYFVRAGITPYLDTSAFAIQAGLDRKRIDQAISLIISELQKIKDNGVEEHELEMAKEFLKGKMILNLEDSENIANYYGKQQLMLGKTQTPEERIKKIEKLTLKDIQKAAQDIMQRSKLSLALIGPFEDKKRFAKLLQLK